MHVGTHSRHWTHCSKQDAEVETAVHNYFKFKITNGDLIYWPEKLESVKVIYFSEENAGCLQI